MTEIDYPIYLPDDLDEAAAALAEVLSSEADIVREPLAHAIADAPPVEVDPDRLTSFQTGFAAVQLRHRDRWEVYLIVVGAEPTLARPLTHKEKP